MWGLHSGLLTQQNAQKVNARIKRNSVAQLSDILEALNSFAAAPRTSLAGLQSTVIALPCSDYKTEEHD